MFPFNIDIKIGIYEAKVAKSKWKVEVYWTCNFYENDDLSPNKKDCGLK